MESDFPLIVEFVGLPGAGKSTVAAQVFEQLQLEGRTVISRSQILAQWHNTHLVKRLFQLVPHRVNHWRVLLNSLFFALRVQPISRWSILQALKTFVNVKRNDAVARAHSNDQIILLDQGAIQELWSVGITGRPPQSSAIQHGIEPILRDRRLAIVYFNADVNTALERIMHRPRKGICQFDMMKPDEAYASLSRYFPCLEKAVHHAQFTGVPVLEVDSSLQIEQQSEAIVAWITAQLDVLNPTNRSEELCSM